VAKKQLLLIIPSNTRGFWGKLHRGKGGLIRLSLPTIAALTPKDQWDVKILDSRSHEINYGLKPDLVGLTAFTGEVPMAYAIADKFRAKGIKVVIGGIHASALPDEALQHADSVVIGEAEYVWEELLSDLADNKLQPKYRAKILCDMKKMVTPAYELIDKNIYLGFNALQATRGCPFDCDYCAVTGVFGRTFRMRPVSEVVDAVKSFKGRDFFFLDDNICGNPAYAKELFKALIPLKKRWGGQASITFAKDNELLSLYHKSGGRYALIGFETITQAGLNGVNKEWNRFSEYKEAISRIHKAKINILATFIFGLPEDDISVFDETLRFVNDNMIDSAQFHILTPFPGTRLYEKMSSQGRITNRDWSYYTTTEVVFKPEKMTAQELQDGYYRIYKEAFSLPNVIRRVFRSPFGIAYRAAMNFSSRNKALRMQKFSR
jgi:radical SAM superfamily enzyme YgiQ (UPF0313 family)